MRLEYAASRGPVVVRSETLKEPGNDRVGAQGIIGTATGGEQG